MVTRSTTNSSGAEARQLLRTHVGDDHTDQERDQRDDGDGRDAGLVDMAGNRNRPQPPRRAQRAACRHGDTADECESTGQIIPAADDPASERFDRFFDVMRPRESRMWQRRRITQSRLDQVQLIRRGAHEIHLRPRQPWHAARNRAA